MTCLLFGLVDGAESFPGSFLRSLDLGARLEGAREDGHGRRAALADLVGDGDGDDGRLLGGRALRERGVGLLGALVTFTRLGRLGRLPRQLEAQLLDYHA